MENLARGHHKTKVRGVPGESGQPSYSFSKGKLKTKMYVGISKKAMGEFGEDSFTGSMNLHARLEYVEQWGVRGGNSRRG